MQALFDAINAVCGKIQVVSDLFWDFPTNFSWYASIPILGNFSLAIILLIGTGIFFSCRLRFIQLRKFKHGIHVLRTRKAESTGISPLAVILCVLFCSEVIYKGFFDIFLRYNGPLDRVSLRQEGKAREME